jgi:hypothetical protein
MRSMEGHRIWSSFAESESESPVQPGFRIRSLKKAKVRSQLDSQSSGSQTIGAKPTSRVHNDLLSGYGELVERWISQGWRAYLVTFMFKPLPGSRRGLLVQMQDEVARFYSTLVTRIVRRPAATSSASMLPILIACADLPVRKNRREHRPGAEINGGLHYNGVLLIPPTSRLRTSLEFHVSLKHRRLYQERARLERIHLTEITRRPGHVVDYVFKTVKNGRLTYDEAVFVLPKTADEIRR